MQTKLYIALAICVALVMVTSVAHAAVLSTKGNAAVLFQTKKTVTSEPTVMAKAASVVTESSRVSETKSKRSTPRQKLGAPTNATICKGDLNGEDFKGDGVVNNFDNTAMSFVIHCNYDAALNARADINSDGYVNGDDGNLLVDLLMGFQTPEMVNGTLKGDMDASGAVNNFDIDLFLMVKSCNGQGKLFNAVTLWKADMNGDNAQNSEDIPLFLDTASGVRKMICK